MCCCTDIINESLNNNILLRVLVNRCHGEILSVVTKDGTTWDVCQSLCIVCALTSFAKSCPFFVNFIFFWFYYYLIFCLVLLIALFSVYDMYVLPFGVTKSNIF